MNHYDHNYAQGQLTMSHYMEDYVSVVSLLVMKLLNCFLAFII